MTARAIGSLGATVSASGADTTARPTGRGRSSSLSALSARVSGLTSDAADLSSRVHRAASAARRGSSAPSPTASALAFRASVGAPDADATAAPASTTVDVEATRVVPPPQPLYLYNSYQGVHRLHEGMSLDDRNEMQSLFSEVKTLCIKYGVMPSDAQDFAIHVNSASVSYKEGGVSIDYKSIIPELEAHPDLEEALAKLKDFRDRKMGFSHTSRHAFSSKMKGDANGLSPLRRSTPALQAYPRSVEHSTRSALELLSQKHAADTAQQTGALKRMAISEAFYDPLKKVTEEQYTAAQASLDAAIKAKKPEPEIVQLRDELNKLKGLRAHIAEMDPYATSVALSFYPTAGSTATVHERAEEARLAVDEKHQKDHEAHDKGRYKWTKHQTNWNVGIRGLPGEHHPEIPYDSNYAGDVGGLFFKTFGEYHRYCADNNLPVKADSFDDVFFKAMLAFDADPSYDVQAALAPYLEGMPVAAKTAIEKVIADATTKAKQIASTAATLDETAFAALPSTEDKISHFRTHLAPAGVTPLAPLPSPPPPPKSTLTRMGEAIRGVFSRTP